MDFVALDGRTSMSYFCFKYSHRVCHWGWIVVQSARAWQWNNSGSLLLILLLYLFLWLHSNANDDGTGMRHEQAHHLLNNERCKIQCRSPLYKVKPSYGYSMFSNPSNKLLHFFSDPIISPVTGRNLYSPLVRLRLETIGKSHALRKRKQKATWKSMKAIDPALIARTLLDSCSLMAKKVPNIASDMTWSLKRYAETE